MKTKPRCPYYVKIWRKSGAGSRIACAKACINKWNCRCCMSCPAFMKCSFAETARCPIVKDPLLKFIALKYKDLSSLSKEE